MPRSRHCDVLVAVLSQTTAIVLAGGLGTRMRAVSDTVPKTMLPVAGRPFIEYLLAYVAAAGVQRAVLAVGHRAEAIASHVGGGRALGLEVAYSEEREPLGTGGALRLASEQVDRWPALALNGDSFVAVDLAAMMAAHQSHRPRLTVALADVRDTGRFGRVRLDAGGRIAAFDEKASSGHGLVNAGVYLLEREVMEMLPNGTSSFERELLPAMAGTDALGFVTSGFFVDIGVPADYQQLVESPAAFLRSVGRVAT
jgi:D-glycero-alpha-D-manno-heptose 1-phosphate guanylyltransferase